MQDAFGGIVNIFLILIFLVIVEGILAFAVSYTKAFRMKNFVISTIEQYEGGSGCFVQKEETACKEKIKSHASIIAYKPTTLNCHNNQISVDGLFCVDPNGYDCAGPHDNSAQSRCYRITTQVDINLPIVNKIMGLEFFQVSGDTRTINVNY